MNPHAISIIIPTYNRAHLITRAINSVLPQMGVDDELLIVDDGSTDNTYEIVAKYGARVRYIKTKNGGCGAARNRGVREATRPFVTFLDSDDEWMPDHNYVLREVMRARPDILFCFTNFATRFKDGTVRRFSLETQDGRDLDWEEIVGPARKLSSFMTIPDGIPDFTCHETDNLYRSLCGVSYLSADTLIVRKDAAGKSLWFADDTKVAEELECGARLAAAGKGLYLHYESTLVHHHTGVQLVDHSGFDMAASRIVVMQRIWGADDNFLREHRAYYDQRLRADKIARVGGFLVRGQTREARQEIAGTDNVPNVYRILASFPGSVTRGLVNFRRAMKSVVKAFALFGLIIQPDLAAVVADGNFTFELTAQLAQPSTLGFLLGA